jgi:hypothetical protein
MFRNFIYLCALAAFLGLGGCKAFEPIEQNFFLGKFLDQKQEPSVIQETYPVLIFRTPGYEIWSKRSANLEMNGTLHPLSVGQVEVIELPAGEHHLKVRPEEGGFDFCDLKLSVNASSRETPAYVEVFERYNPSGQMLSMVLAEIEANTKYPLEPGQFCFGRFGLVQGTLPKGTDLGTPLTAQVDRVGPSSP